MWDLAFTSGPGLKWQATHCWAEEPAEPGAGAGLSWAAAAGVATGSAAMLCPKGGGREGTSPPL